MIGSAVVIGVAVAGSLFIFYPNMLLRNTGFDRHSSSTDVPVLIDPNNPTSTAGKGTNSTNSTSNATTTTPRPDYCYNF